MNDNKFWVEYIFSKYRNLDQLSTSMNMLSLFTILFFLATLLLEISGEAGIYFNAINIDIYNNYLLYTKEHDSERIL